MEIMKNCVQICLPMKNIFRKTNFQKRNYGNRRTLFLLHQKHIIVIVFYGLCTAISWLFVYIINFWILMEVWIIHRASRYSTLIPFIIFIKNIRIIWSNFLLNQFGKTITINFYVILQNIFFITSNHCKYTSSTTN